MNLRAWQRLIACCGGLLLLAAGQAAEADWKKGWEVAEGFSLDIDVEGFNLPSAIAMVPNPGPGPKDPYYFVTELFGKVKVVTRDRTIYTFAENFFTIKPEIPPPSTWGEIGMAGIVLDPAHGYVFVSFAYHDKNWILRNNIVRFESKPGTFGLQATGSKSFTDIFDADVSWVNYQIGPMVVDGNHLYVATGDGGNPKESQNLDFTTGKILRMTLDGQPVPDNPHYVDNDVNKARNFVWARGFRNVFGLSMVDGRLLASENGIRVDRFLEIRRGENYRWDGSDWSLSFNMPMVFGPTVGPVQISWAPADSPQLPEKYRSKFFMAMSYGEALTSGIAVLDYDFKNARMVAVPEKFVVLRPPPDGRLNFAPDAIIQKVVGAAVGSDGIYMVALYPIRKEKGAKGAVVRIRHDPQNANFLVPGADDLAFTMMTRLGCLNCHSFEGDKVKAAPPLDPETLITRLSKRLNSPEYARSLEEINRLDMTPFTQFRDARQQMMAAQGNERVRHWLVNRLKEPMFDRKASAMPSFSMNDKDANLIADYLIRRDVGVSGGSSASYKNRLRALLPETPKRRHLAIAAGVGFVGALGMMGIVLSIRRLRQRSRSR